MTNVSKYLISNTADLDGLEKTLTNQMYVHGHQPGSEDSLLFYQWFSTKSEPCKDKYPALWAWYALISLYNPAVLEVWKNVKVEEPKKKGGEPKKKEDKPKDNVDHTKPTKHEAPADECDDLFADETPEDIKKREELEAKKKLEKENKDKEKKPAKVVIAKSLIILDVKVWDMEQDLDKLAKKIISDIVKDGLTWKTEYKLVDVAFGIKKIRIGCVVEDEKVSIDDINSQLEAWEDDVQSVDIVSFDKI